MSITKTVPAAFIPRTVFPNHNVTLANFHGHHRKALFSMRQLAFKIDMVLELRDARAPISSLNPLFDQVLAGKPKLVLYTKSDLSTLKSSQIEAWDPSQDFMRIDCSLRKDGSRVLKYLREKLGAAFPPPPLGHRILITGMPNAGKSTFLNTLRTAGTRNKTKVARTGNQPGVTRNVSETVTISETPKLLVFDTPGVFVPQVRDAETMMKMCLIGAVNPSLIEPTILADYLLFKLNQAYPKGGRYPGAPTNEVNELLNNLWRTGMGRHDFKKHPKYARDDNSLSANWIRRYTQGGLGKMCLDDVTVEAYKEALDAGYQQQVDLGAVAIDTRERKRFIM